MFKKKEDKKVYAQYSDELADYICNQIAFSEHSIQWHCINNEKFPKSKDTFFSWLKKNTYFADKYREAKKDQADHIVDGLIDLIDECPETRNGIEKGRQRVDVRKWFAAKARPAVYGEKVFSGTMDKQGDPVDSQPTLDLSKLTVEELETLKLLHSKAQTK